MSRRRRARIGGLPRVGQQVPLDPRRLRHGARATSSVGTRTPLQRQKTCRAFSSGRAETRVSGETTTRGRPTRHSRARAHAPIRPFHASRATFVAVHRPRRARARSGVRPRGGDSQSATSGVHGHTRRGGRERLPLSRVATRLLPRLHRGHRPRCASASTPLHARVARETFASTSQPARRARNAPPAP